MISSAVTALLEIRFDADVVVVVLRALSVGVVAVLLTVGLTVAFRDAVMVVPREFEFAGTEPVVRDVEVNALRTTVAVRAGADTTLF